MPRALALLPLLAATLPAPGTAQSPDFSGSWIRLVDSAATRPSVAASGDAAFRRGDMGVGWGSPITIKQTADSLSVEYAFFSAYDLQPPLHFGYALDGSETRNDMMISHATATQRSRVAWQGATLVITTTHAAPALAGGRPGSITVRQSLTLDAPDRLVIQAVRPAAAGGAADTVRAVYLRRGGT